MTHEHKACHGTMFHDTLHFETNNETNKEMKGKVFKFELASIGLARSGRSIKMDISGWDDCLKCAEFEHCYKLCMAKVALAAAIAEK